MWLRCVRCARGQTVSSLPDGCSWAAAMLGSWRRTQKRTLTAAALRWCSSWYKTGSHRIQICAFSFKIAKVRLYEKMLTQQRGEPSTQILPALHANQCGVFSGSYLRRLQVPGRKPSIQFCPLIRVRFKPHFLNIKLIKTPVTYITFSPYKKKIINVKKVGIYWVIWLWIPHDLNPESIMTYFYVRRRKNKVSFAGSLGPVQVNLISSLKCLRVVPDPPPPRLERKKIPANYVTFSVKRDHISPALVSGSPLNVK